MKMKASGIALAAVVGILFLAFPPSHNPQAAPAPDLTCTGPQTGGTFNNVVVPSGDTCTLDGVRILGNVTVESGAALGVNNLRGPTTIAGNVSTKGCNYIFVNTSFSTTNLVAVGGDVSIDSCTGAVPGLPASIFITVDLNAFPATPPSLLIGGNLQCDMNSHNCALGHAVVGRSFDCSGNSGACQVLSNAIGKNASFDNNSGGADIENNAIGGNLECSGNSSGVTNGSGPNTVAGTESGQCAGL